MKNGIVILIVVMLIGINVYLIAVNSTNPRSYVLPNESIVRVTDKGYRGALEKLSVEDRKLLMGFYAGWSATGGGKFPEGFTIGAAIDAQLEVLMGVGYEMQK